MRIAINGLGRTGRQALRLIHAAPGLELVGLNDLAEPASLAHLVTYDSVHGRAGFAVGREGGNLLLDGRPVPLFREPEPDRVPFAELGAELVLECTGRFTRRADAARHLGAGVARVVIAAPSADADATWIPGLDLDLALADAAAAPVLAAACPASHALALLVRVLDEAFGVRTGMATAVESYQNDQRILDLPHPDLRLARAAALSMIPCPSAAAQSLAQAWPAMAGRFAAQAIRVPTPDVGILDLSVTLDRPADAAAIQAAFAAAAAGPLRGLLEVLEAPLVSADLRGAAASAIFDPLLTRVLAPGFVKVFAWFDNEVAYAARLRDLALLLGGSR
jgi:glyceraldehyde 3-phosphate dehydrogenase